MACITLVAPMAMATTQLARIIPCQEVSDYTVGPGMERNHLRLSWIVATDSDGNRKLQMQWTP